MVIIKLIAIVILYPHVTDIEFIISCNSWLKSHNLKRYKMITSERTKFLPLFQLKAALPACAYIRGAEWPIFIITFWVVTVTVARPNLVYGQIWGRRRGSRLERVEIQFGSIFMTVRKRPKMNLEWASSSSPDISVPPILNYLPMLRFQ